MSEPRLKHPISTQYHLKKIQFVIHSFCSLAYSLLGILHGWLGQMLWSSLLQQFGKAAITRVKSLWAAAKDRSQPAREPPGSSPCQGGSRQLGLVVVVGTQNCFVHLSVGDWHLSIGDRQQRGELHTEKGISPEPDTHGTLSPPTLNLVMDTLMMKYSSWAKPSPWARLHAKNFACILSHLVFIETPWSRSYLFLFYEGESWSLKKFWNLPG